MSKNSNTENEAVGKKVYEAIHSNWTRLYFKGHGASFKVDCKSCFCSAGETICFPPQCPSLDNSGEPRRAFTGVWICFTAPTVFQSYSLLPVTSSVSSSLFQVFHVAVLNILFQCVPVMDARTPVPVWRAVWASKTINLCLAPAGVQDPAHPTHARETRGESRTVSEQWWHISQSVITLGTVSLKNQTQHVGLVIRGFKPELGFNRLSVQSFMCSPCFCVDFLPGTWFPPNFQKHAGWISVCMMPCNRPVSHLGCVSAPSDHVISSAHTAAMTMIMRTLKMN